MSAPAPASRRRMAVAGHSVPKMARGVKLRFDETRERWVLLVPERVLAPDEIAIEILQLCDGERSVSAMVDLLAEKYAAPKEEIEADVIAMLQDLADSGFLIDGVRPERTPLFRFGRATSKESGRKEMSPTLDRHSEVHQDPTDGLALLEGKGKPIAAQYGIPLAVLLELTHRCPLQCPYCSNPVEMERARNELSTEEWKRVLDELAEIGVLQIHFSGGEPTARKDIVELIQYATDLDLYTNLITSAVLLTKDKLTAIADAGLSHIQISFQGSDAARADRVAGFRNAHVKKREVAQWARELDLPLTVNAVMHRQNLDQLSDIIDMAVEMDADRIEVANVQYYGWALKNRAALMPTIEQIDASTRIVEEARVRLKGILDIDFVIPDYYAERPKKCMGGWGRQFFNITPSGKVLPCHAAESIEGLDFLSVRSNHSIAWIWQNSEAFNRYRGTGWMPEPCQSCAFKEIDYGGCRCQAFALTGSADNTDPACAFSPLHEKIFKTAETEAETGATRFLYRNFSGGTLETEAADDA